MSDPYRDPLAGLRSQLQLVQAEVRELEQQLTDAIWPLLPQSLADRVQAGKAACALPLEESHESLSRGLAACESYLSALRETKELVPQLEQQLRELRPDAPDLHQSPSLLDLQLGHWQVSYEEIHRLISELDPQSQQDPHPGGQYYTTFQLEGVPYAIRGLAADSSKLSATWKVQLATSVPLGFPALRLRPEGLRHTLLLKPLGLVHEQQLGKASFDGCFLIEGSAAAVEQLLSEEVQEGLMQLAYYDVPTLEVTPGRAVLSWTYGTERAVLQIATRVLALLRQRPVRLKLLRDEAD